MIQQPHDKVITNVAKLLSDWGAPQQRLVINFVNSGYLTATYNPQFQVIELDVNSCATEQYATHLNTDRSCSWR